MDQSECFPIRSSKQSQIDGAICFGKERARSGNPNRLQHRQLKREVKTPLGS